MYRVPTQVSNQREPGPIHMGALFTKQNPAEDFSGLCKVLVLRLKMDLVFFCPVSESARRCDSNGAVVTRGGDVRLGHAGIHPLGLEAIA